MIGHIEKLHKSTMSSIVVPVLGSVTCVLLLSTFAPTIRWLLGFLMWLVGSGANAFIASKQPKFKIFGLAIDSGSDRMFAARWYFDFLIVDTINLYLFDVSAMQIMGWWGVLCLGAVADTFRRHHRIPVLTSGIIAGAYLLHYMHPEVKWQELALFVAVLIGQCAFFLAIERYWFRELCGKLMSNNREREAASAAEGMSRDASYGNLLFVMSHEMGSLLFQFDAYLGGRENELATKSRKAEQRRELASGVENFRRLRELILNDVRRRNVRREISIKDLLVDVELLTRKIVEAKGSELVVEVSEGTQNMVISERSGSVYFILQNLLSNAAEASAEWAEKSGLEVAPVILRASDAGSSRVMLEVEDKGGGVNEEIRHAILSGGPLQTTKVDGHGIGLRFVRSEVERNGFSIDIKSTTGVGTVMRLILTAKDYVPESQIPQAIA